MRERERERERERKRRKKNATGCILWVEQSSSPDRSGYLVSAGAENHSPRTEGAGGWEGERVERAWMRQLKRHVNTGPIKGYGSLGNGENCAAYAAAHAPLIRRWQRSRGKGKGRQGREGERESEAGTGARTPGRARNLFASLGAERV